MSDLISRADAIAVLSAANGTSQKTLDAIRATPVVEVGVRELDWVYGKAKCEVGTYLVDSGWADHVGGKRWWAWVRWDGGGEADPFLVWQYGERCETEESAKAAAQADYAALTATPVQDCREHSGDTDCSVTAYAAIARMKEEIK